MADIYSRIRNCASKGLRVKVVRIVLVLVVAGGLGIVAFRVAPVIAFSLTIHSQNVRKERQILYEIDHEVFATIVREFAAAHGWNESFVDHAYFTNTDPEVPTVLRGLGFSLINMYDDRVDVDFGGPSLSFGISVFQEGLEGYGTKKLNEGVWFYSENGKVPPP